MTFAVLLGESDSDQRVRRQLELGDVEAPADAVSRGLLVAEPVAHAEPEQLRDPVPLRLWARTALLEVVENRSFAVDEPIEPQPIVRNWNCDRRRLG
jgi:hypothetical protein